MENGSFARKLFAQALGLLIICIGTGFSALAQDDVPNAEPSPENPSSQGPGPGKQGHSNPDKIKQRQLARLEKIAKITQDQETKITPVISNFVDQLVAVRNDSSLQPDAKKAKQKEIRKQYNRQLRSLLTPEQRQALKNAKGQKQGNGQNGNQDEDQKFEQGSNQPGSDI
jgi:periplasmic protein CpxP/Spy